MDTRRRNVHKGRVRHVHLLASVVHTQQRTLFCFVAVASFSLIYALLLCVGVATTNLVLVWNLFFVSVFVFIRQRKAFQENPKPI